MSKVLESLGVYNHWHVLARELDGTFAPRWLSSPKLCIARPGTAITVTIQAAANAGSRRYTIVVDGSYTLPIGPRFKLLKQGTLRMWLTNFGYQDLEIGDPLFDLRYIVRGESEALVRQALVSVKDEISRNDSILVSSTRKRVRVSVKSDALLNVPATRLAVDVCSRIATTDLLGLGALRALDGAVETWPALSAPPVITINQPGRVEFTAKMHAGRAVTVLRAPNHGGRTPAVVCDVAAETPSHWSEAARRLAGRIGCSSLIATPKTLELVFDQLVTDRDVLIDAAHLLHLVSQRTSMGVYR